LKGKQTTRRGKQGEMGAIEDSGKLIRWETGQSTIAKEEHVQLRGRIRGGERREKAGWVPERNDREGGVGTNRQLTERVRKGSLERQLNRVQTGKGGSCSKTGKLFRRGSQEKGWGGEGKRKRMKGHGASWRF